ncbi:MAG: hypothetical protein JWO08_2360 [Verrucomicrobiaceae bacterium]|nr:hypothetical protein [Verrucomicrobiaceae bacterium]
MTANLKLNLSDGLTTEELRELTALTLEADMPLERLLLVASRDYLDRRRPLPPTPSPAPGSAVPQRAA